MPTTTVKQTRTEVVFDAIRDEVLSVRIPPGTKMKLADYSQRFDVSLAVVREAMGRLAEQGLLQANPQRGFSTLPLSVGDLFELTRARIVIETATLRESITNGDLAWEGSVVAAHHQLAATAMYDESGTINRDFALVHRDFHVALLAGAANSHLESIATSLRDRSELYQYWSRYLGDGPNGTSRASTVNSPNSPSPARSMKRPTPWPGTSNAPPTPSSSTHAATSPAHRTTVTRRLGSRTRTGTAFSPVTPDWPFAPWSLLRHHRRAGPGPRSATNWPIDLRDP